MIWPSEASTAAWVALLRAHRLAFGRVEADLKAAGFPPLAWYDALLELRREPEGLRAVDLEGRMLLAQYSISRLVERLERAGYLERRPDPQDGRVRLLVLTSAGGELLQAMWPVYAGAIERHIGTALKREEAQRLAGLLQRILDHGSGEA